MPWPEPRRSSGVLLHPTSLPGPFGIGDLGPTAKDWVQTLARAGQRWWQVLPVGPTGYADSPYQSPSAFAGNPNLLSPEWLVENRLASASDSAACELPAGDVDFPAVIPRKQRLARVAWDRFRAGDAPQLRPAIEAFRASHGWWLEEYARFAAVKWHFDRKPWWEWPAELADRNETALARITADLADEIDGQRFEQFLFFRQWAELREYARKAGVRLIGDLPLYVAHDSADVWAGRELFGIGKDRKPAAVAGVPPDYFSPTGQLWGNPIYDWPAMQQTGFAWWIDRFRATLELVDVVRFDHFRGVEAYWSVPCGDPTAEHGTWVPGPGAELLQALHDATGSLPIIAEDLGVITPEVDALRAKFALPGMRILQFAFGGAVEDRFRPYCYEPGVVVYTGTHDNDTTCGWFDKLTAEERADFVRYAPEAAREPVKALVRLAWASVADTAIVPFQDILDLGSAARFNTPGTTSGNWRWRADPSALTDREWAIWLRELTQTYGRMR
jgi:4-alpha-glucanotransferase